MAEVQVPEQDLLVDKAWDIDVPAQLNRSEWTSRSKVTGLPGAETWSFSCKVRYRSSRALQRPWDAFFLALKGIENKFRIVRACQRHVGPMPLVAAGAGDGYALPLKGMTPQTTILEAGQFMAVPLPSGHVRLVGLTADLFTDAVGNATAQFAPALGEIPALNTVVETAHPYTFFNLVNRSNRASGPEYSIQAVEAL
ncbi:MAG: hypothetical protein ACRCVX_12480 [Shewanella sp.]